MSGDFGVPTPVAVRGGLIFAGENNGVQLFRQAGSGFGSRPVAINDTLIPDSHPPVSIDGKLLVAMNGLHCLSIADGLNEEWCVGESLITGYASLIVSSNTALVTTENGRLVLFRFGPRGCEIIDQLRLAETRVRVLSHPAVIADKLVIRVGTELRCYRLGP